MLGFRCYFAYFTVSAFTCIWIYAAETETKKLEPEGHSECAKGEQPLPKFSSEPMTNAECELYSSIKCWPLLVPFNKCVILDDIDFDVKCTAEKMSMELKRTATIMANLPLRPSGIEVFDAVTVMPTDIKPIRKQILVYYLRECMSPRSTGKLNDLRLSNLLQYSLYNCSNLLIRKHDFQHSCSLKVITFGNSTIVTLQENTFTNLPALRLLSLDYVSNAENNVVFSKEWSDYLYRLHCDCDWVWFRKWWNNNNTAIIKRADFINVGELFSVYSEYTEKFMSEWYVQKNLYLPVDCAANPHPTELDSINFNQTEFSIHESFC
ncbi:uncharacterized protein LOC129585564 [Paramacrobiotus metropolitanus]|uniref:uncharacterized protein LOC129585564 n=1 Tax=Paramacrobiotus metropolitanus TaxID=2943436 RepID=UPI002445F968|nr:uncharacterized protein LOC129585564 [Paramacrobiotus metropolitanus]